MKTVWTTATMVVALVLVGSSIAASPPKQNGSTPVIKAFTPICAVPGYADYGLCGGQTTTFSGVSGKMNAIQPKPGVYNLEFSFTGLTPGVEYRLWATKDAILPWTEVGRMVATETGSLSFKYQTNAPAGLGFDLNTIDGDITIVTSWWSGQKLVVNADGTLSTAV
jgi:hypothetical protein